MDAGRYLAGDIGATVALERTFSNGWRFGGFFTLTDVSAEDFGEGSFDKGIRVTIPLGWLVGKTTRSAYGLTIRPVQRDGGQRVHVPGRLYGANPPRPHAEPAGTNREDLGMMGWTKTRATMMRGLLLMAGLLMAGCAQGPDRTPLELEVIGAIRDAVRQKTPQQPPVLTRALLNTVPVPQLEMIVERD